MRAALSAPPHGNYTIVKGARALKLFLHYLVLASGHRGTRAIRRWTALCVYAREI